MRNGFHILIRNTYWVVFSLCAIFGQHIFAASGGPYDLSWSTIDSGGGSISGGDYIMMGTVGQPDAGYHYGTSYELLGGFWVGGPRWCMVDLEDFDHFSEYWLEVSCDAGNNYCSGTDLNGDNSVDINDLALFAGEWLTSCPPNWPLR